MVVEQSCRELGASERKACKVLKQSRSTQRYKPKLPDKDKPVIDDLLVLHVKHPRYSYRRITIKLREKGWFINFKRVYRLWCQEGFKVPRRQHKKLHTGTSENSCSPMLVTIGCGLISKPAAAVDLSTKLGFAARNCSRQW